MQNETSMLCLARDIHVANEILWCPQAVLNDFQATMKIAKSREAASLPRKPQQPPASASRSGMTHTTHI